MFYIQFLTDIFDNWFKSFENFIVSHIFCQTISHFLSFVFNPMQGSTPCGQTFNFSIDCYNLLADSSQLDIQTTEESKHLNIEQKNGLTSGQPSNYRKTKRIAKRMAIKTISDLKANSSPNSPKDSGAFIWIGFAVVFVILVVIALIWYSFQ